VKQLISAELAAHLEETTTTLCACVRIEREDGEVLCFTDHDTEVTVDAETYKPAQGAIPSMMAQANDLSVDNLEISALLSSALTGLKITEADIEAGVYDHATVDFFIVNWADVSMGVVYLARGWRLGQIEIQDSAISCELRGKAYAFESPICEVCTPDCRATLGDTRCGVDLTSSVSPYRYAGTVVSSATPRTFVDTGVDSAIDDEFDYGVLEWITGDNAGRFVDVKTYDAGTGTFTLLDAMPETISPGDTYEVTWGCDKLWTTCKSRFDNLVNFRGEPSVPGYDIALDMEMP
jgi:uncharacterized phage protein (TIGR02218 family)